MEIEIKRIDFSTRVLRFKNRNIRHRCSTVLVVDDNSDAATTLSMLLEMFGHKVRVAHDGIDALKQMKQFTPQVVCLDIVMPRLDGYQTVEIMRQTKELKQTYVVALTGWGAAEDRMRIKEAGFDFHLTKPVQLDEVEQIFANLDIGKASSVRAGFT